jgi:hypothetical protein
VFGGGGGGGGGGGVGASYLWGSYLLSPGFRSSWMDGQAKRNVFICLLFLVLVTVSWEEAAFELGIGSR